EVVARAAGDQVVARAGEEEVGAAQAEEEVVALLAEQHVAGGAAGDGVVDVAALERGGGQGAIGLVQRERVVPRQAPDVDLVRVGGGWAPRPDVRRGAPAPGERAADVV